ncbi:7b5457fa-fabd-4d6e-8d85-62c7acc76be2 [Sclerotinia trifoliorum]|uniref:7b5457fa-fabd-4d6e-8d85-62c7acc76be2 n=1 Tax=Sclerotinia trifoliorum TaxID=28548 RepID=A0A8H2VUZ6_9HELO|nr:7b5457fa-fabd-4d6e-8d85-62c7acc76be2 [Sclerotinia trifoliorum]
MSLNLPSRRLLRSAAPLTTSRPPITFLIPLYTSQRRSLWDNFSKRLDSARRMFSPNKAPSDPLTEEFLMKKKDAQRQNPERGNLSKSSIFEDEDSGSKRDEKTKGPPRNPEIMARALDPYPNATLRWKRKMVIQEVKKRGRLTKEQTLKRTERVLLSKSHDFKTSVKKLVPLAKQIAGKTVEDAIIQMRFSKKKVAKDVKEHLEHARNEAIVKRGMGLGKLERKSTENFKTRYIVTKDGKRVKVEDPTALYVDEAWCGKGDWGKSYDFRARGNVNIMKNRTTSISLVLKEEKTRIRLHEEREEKLKNKKVWVQLPNRPVTAQRQYYSW